MKVTLVAYTQLNPEFSTWNPHRLLFTISNDPCLSDPEVLTAAGKRVCNTADSIKTIFETQSPRKIKIRNRDTIKSGHFGVFEHISFTFLIEGFSRNMTHQLVRHRMASYLQMSQRVVPMKDVELIVPPSISEHAELQMKMFDAMLACYKVYNELKRVGIPMGDARYIMPHGMETRVWMTINASSLMHFLRLRLLNSRAQWEIKEVARQMYEIVKDLCPTIFREDLQEYWE